MSESTAASPTGGASHAGVVIFAITVVAGTSVMSALLHAMHLSVDDASAVPFVLAAMWVPALARLVATSTADRGWRSPFPITHWGTPRMAIVVVPLAIVGTTYVGAYALAWLTGVQTEAAVWRGGRAAINVALNLPLLAIIGLFGALGEELGWRGYLQPRLDQIGVPASLLWVIALETLFHVPLILFAGYLTSSSTVTSIALFFGLSLGLTPVWTWATYHWRTIWVATWFHTIHNAVSQVILPKTLGVGDPLILGESGVFPVALYLLTAAIVFGIARARGERWRDLASRALHT